MAENDQAAPSPENVSAVQAFKQRFPNIEPRTAIHDGHRERLRVAARRDCRLNGFRDEEILEMALACFIPQRDVNPMAHALMLRFGSVLDILKAPARELLKISGMTAVAATLLPDMITLCLWRFKNGTDVIIRTPHAAANYFGSIFLRDRTEGLYAACMDAAGKLLGTERCDDNGYISARTVFDAVCKHNTDNVLIVRRYAEAYPDAYDLADDTVKITELLSEVGVKLLDVMMFTDFGFYSLGIPPYEKCEPEFIFVPHKDFSTVSALVDVLRYIEE